VADLASALAHSSAADLLPHRQRALAGAIRGPLRLVDALALDEGGWLAIVGTAAESLIVPGKITDGRFVRWPVTSAALRSPDAGRFRVDLLGDPPPAGGLEQPIDVDQTNESIILAGSWVVKWQLLLTPNPTARRLRSIATARDVGLIPAQRLTPAPRAVIEWQGESGEWLTLATAVDYVQGAEDGWDWAVRLVREHSRGLVADAISPFARIGQMAARMHLAFSAEGIEVAGAADLLGIRQAAVEDLDEALRLVDGPEGQRLRERQGALRTELDALQSLDRTPVIDVHGDFHLGQVLRSPDDEYLIVDFDGSPVLPPMERLRRAPAARDVAGMLASIDHIARVVNHRTPGLDPAPALAWIPQAQAAFLDAYRMGLDAAGRQDLLDQRLIRPFVLQQECREFIYSVRHLPHWRYVPDAVLTDMFPV
jgi:maltokinase